LKQRPGKAFDEVEAAAWEARTEAIAAARKTRTEAIAAAEKAYMGTD